MKMHVKYSKIWLDFSTHSMNGIAQNTKSASLPENNEAGAGQTDHAAMKERSHVL